MVKSFIPTTKFKKLELEKDCYSQFNMKSFLCFFVLILVVSACSSSGSNSTKEVVLTEEQMVEITQEVLLLENYYQSKYGSPSVYKKALDSSVNVVFKKFSVTKKDYENSFDYYTENPDLYRELQMKIIESLNEKHL